MRNDQRNIATINELAANTKAAALKWYEYCKEQGIEILIYDALRTEAEQRANIANGVSKTMKSYHIVGQALDFVPIDPKNGSALWNGYGAADIKKAISKAKALGFEWGGDWKGFVDKPHLQFNYKGYGTDTFKSVAKLATAKQTATPTKKDTIKSIQTELNKRYKTKLTVDGIVGKATEKAIVTGYQTELNANYGSKLVVDGIFGTKTKNAIKTIKKGSPSKFVYLVQAALYIKGYDPKGIDGIFGNGTTKAVKEFQKAKGLEDDGLAGKNTISALIK